MTLKGGTSQACAACKYQRRKCSSECPLAPYFPPDQPKMFQNAHRLFGVSNILKILKQLDQSQKREAMTSIIYQANIRDRYPVHGCCRVIHDLEYQICQGLEELHAVHAQLALYRQQQHEISSTLNDSTSELQLGMGPPSNNALALFNQDAPQCFNAVSALPVGSNQCFPNSDNIGYNSGFVENDNVANSFWINDNNSSNNNNNDPMELQSQLVAFQQLTIQQESTQVVVDDEMHPFFEIIDDRQSSYIDSKEAYESSSDSSSKDTTQPIEHVADNELKNAAACFSLTSVN